MERQYIAKVIGNVSDWLSYTDGAPIKVADSAGSTVSTIFQALTKFLKCVNWNQPQETKQALELLSNWNPMDVEDALELLSPSFTHPSVRKYAVSRLRQADDEVRYRTI